MRTAASDARLASSDIKGVEPRFSTSSAIRLARSAVKSSRFSMRPSPGVGSGRAAGCCGDRSDNTRLPLSPIAVADEALVELARGVTRQLAFEVDGARTLDRREALPAPRDQFGGEFRCRVFPIEGLHDRLHFFSEILIRYADHGDICDPCMCDDQILRLLRV